MAVAYRCSGGNGSGATAQTSLSITKPTSPSAVQNGDVMYLWLSFAATTPTVTPASGWTSIAGPTNAPSGSMRHQLFRKTASSEGSSWTFSLSSAAKWFAVVWVGSGIDTSNPNDTPTISGMSGAAPFTTAAAVPDEQSWGVYFCGADYTAALTWNNSSQTRRFTGDSGSGTSHLNGAVADTAGIISSNQTCGWTPSPLGIQGGAICSFAVNAPPITFSTATTGATGAANDATVTKAVAPAADAAAATGAANDATVTKTVSVSAECPNATAAGLDATVSFATTASAGVATATAAANDVVPALTLSSAAECPDATAAGLDATVLTGADPTAEVAHAAASANDATITLASAPDAGAAAATAAALDTTITSSASVSAECATATADAYGATITTTIPIAYFGSGTGTVSGGQTLSVSTPASIPAGAAIILCAGGFCTSATPTPSGSGWTLIDTNGTGSARFWTWIKIATGGEGTITVTMDGSNDLFGVGGLSVYTGVNASSPVVSHSAAVWSGVTHSTVTSPSVNNSGTSSDCAVFCGAFYNGSTGHGQTTPTNMSVAYDYGDGSEGSSFTFYRLNAPTGSQSYSTNATGGQTDWYGGNSLLFLAPAVGVNASAEAAPATAAGLDATTTLASAPTADAAPATADGLAAIAGLGLAVEVPDAGAAALDATVDAVPVVGADADAATAAGEALDATTDLAALPPAGEAATTAAALDATVTLADDAPAGVGTATADAYDSTVEITSDGEGHAESPDVGAAALDASAELSITSDAAEAIGDAYDATVSVEFITDAPAEVSEVSAEALDASVDVTVNSGLAVGTARALSTSTAEEAQVTSDAFDALIDAVWAPDEASTTADAYDATIEVLFDVDTAEATAHASSADVSRNVSVDAEVADAVADSFGALGTGFNVTATDSFTYSVESERRVEEVDRESRTYVPEGDWYGIDSILA